jgi:outer membrane protein assembly factor BamD (BamD/ComL family)
MKDTLTDEAQLLGTALRQLRDQRDPAGALATLDDYRTRFPRGTLSDEATLHRIEALLALGRPAAAFGVLDERLQTHRPLPPQMRVVRVEIMSQADQCEKAMDELDLLVGSQTGSLLERALFTRATCHQRLGKLTQSHADLQSYLERFPQGQFADKARRELEK